MKDALSGEPAIRDALYREAARAVLGAMREPMEAMLDAGNEEMAFDDVSPAWPAMIDAALA